MNELQAIPEIEIVHYRAEMRVMDKTFHADEGTCDIELGVDGGDAKVIISCSEEMAESFINGTYRLIDVAIEPIL